MIYNKFQVFDKGTWMAPFIREALTIDRTIPGKVRYNHCAVAIEKRGKLYIQEAGFNHLTGKAEVFRRPFAEWIKGRDPRNFISRKPGILYDDREFRERADELLEVPYYFAGVLLFSPIKLITEQWYGRTDTEKVYCSSHNAYLYQLKDFYRIDPEEYNKRLNP